MFKFLKNLLTELAANGKSLIAWLINESGATGMPGVADALQAFLANPNDNTLGFLVFQLFWAGASGHRVLKILAKVLPKARR